jgi:hypothetical protein
MKKVKWRIIETTRMQCNEMSLLLDSKNEKRRVKVRTKQKERNKHGYSVASDRDRFSCILGNKYSYLLFLITRRRAVETNCRPVASKQFEGFSI